MKGEMLFDFDVKVKEFIVKLQVNLVKIVSCKVFQNVIEVFGLLLLEFFGGFVDLVLFNLILWFGFKVINEDVVGNYIYYGVCEFGMIVIVNGIFLYGGFLLYIFIFLMFVEYVCNVVCMVVLMKQCQVMVYIYDFIGLGEDGLIYQLVEQVVFLCVILNMFIWCLCDQVEFVVVWKYGVECQDGLTVLIFFCQNLVQQE